MNRHLTLYNPDGESDPAIPAECQGTIDRLQAVLDGLANNTSLREDPHLAVCRDCAERVQAAGVMTRALRTAATSSPFPVEGILAAIAADRAVRSRRRWIVGSAGVAVAAGLLLAIFFRPTDAPPVENTPPVLVEATKPPVAPAPRIGEAFTDAGQAIQGLGRMITEPPRLSPDVFDSLSEVLALPPMTDLEPAAASLAELPEAALKGLEPVAGSASRVITHLLEDVSVMPRSTPPKMKS